MKINKGKMAKFLYYYMLYIITNHHIYNKNLDNSFFFNLYYFDFMLRKILNLLSSGYQYVSGVENILKQKYIFLNI